MRYRTQKEEVKMRKMMTTDRKVGRRVTLPRTEQYWDLTQRRRKC